MRKAVPTEYKGILYKSKSEAKVCVSSLYFGSVFTLDRGYLFGGYSGCKPLDYDWIKHHEQDIRNYRYDLVDTNA